MASLPAPIGGLLVLATVLLSCDASGGNPPASLNESFAPMVFDTARGVAVFFGAFGGARGGETWERAGGTWTLRATTGPAPREGHALAYDSTRGVTVLFGGREAGAFLGDTWEWDGSTWTERVVTTGPRPRYSHAMAYDSTRKVTILFGGTVKQTSAAPSRDRETWEWNGTAWRLRTVSVQPSSRTRQAMAFDSARGVMVLFGGYKGSLDNETWEWNGTRWTLRAPAVKPSGRYFHAMAYDSARAVTVLFGGYDGERVGETWEWNGTTWTQQPVVGPSPRVAPGLAFDSSNGVTVLFGGFDGAYTGETWEWNGTAWTEKPPVAPEEPGLGLQIRGYLVDSRGEPAGSARFEIGPDGAVTEWRIERERVGGAVGASSRP